MKKRILFIEDDATYQKFIASLLIREGYEVTMCDNAVDAIEIYHEDKFHLILTDLMMDSVDGMQLLSYIRNYDYEIKIIMLTANEGYEAEIQALNMSADDYIYKPVMPDVLLARIARALADPGSKKSGVLYSEQDGLQVDTGSHQVYKDGEKVYLTAKEFALLVFFLKNKNKAFSRTEILEMVWRVSNDSVDTRSVDTLVKKLRAKLLLTSIFSIRGVGYEWVEE